MLCACAVCSVPVQSAVCLCSLRCASLQCACVLHQAFRARHVRKNNIGGEVRHGVTSGVSYETSKTWNVTPLTSAGSTGVSEKHAPFVRAFALQSCSRNCSPAPDFVLFEGFIFQRIFCSGGVFFKDTGVKRASGWFSDVGSDRFRLLLTPHRKDFCSYRLPQGHQD